MKSGIAYLLVGVILAAGSALADKTWTGAANTDFEDGGNWGGTAPTNDTTTDIAIFNGAAPANQPVLTTNRSVRGIQFSGGGANWNLFTNAAPGAPFTLTVGTYGVRNTGGNNGDSNTVNTNAVLSVSGTTDIRTHNENLFIRARITGTGDLRFDGTISDNNQRSIYLYGDNDYSGTSTIVDDAYVNIFHPNALGTASNTVVVYGGGGSFREWADLAVRGSTAPYLNANKTIQIGHDNGTPTNHNDDVGYGRLFIGAGVTLANDIDVYGQPNTYGVPNGTLIPVDQSGVRYVTGTITVHSNAVLRVSRYSPAGGVMYLNRDSGGTVLGKITGPGRVFHAWSGSSYNQDIYIYGTNDYTGGTTMGVDWGCGNDIRVYSDAAFGSGPVYLQANASYPTYPHFRLGANVMMPNDFRAGNSADIATGSFVLTTTGAIRPGDTGLAAVPAKNIGRLDVEDLQFGSDTDGCTYYWQYDETGSDRIAATTLAFGSCGNVVNCEWLGAGDPPTPPETGTSYVLFTYSGADPDDVPWTVKHRGRDLDGHVTVDSVNKRVLLTLYVRPTLIRVK